jgi:ATP-dependent Clp protease ATP-binding subunit ClpX
MRLSSGRLCCSFCGRDETEVTRLIAGARGHICEACVGECVTVLQDHGGFDVPQRNRKH